MNRLILIGNGFDLAHGLKTSYGHFIEWICKTIVDELEKTIAKDAFSDSLGLVSASGMPYKEIVGNLDFFFTKGESAIESILKVKDRFEFNNQFFEVILDQYAQNWSDIEAIYNDQLHLNKKESSKIKQLNEDLRAIKNLLAKYLNKITQETTLNNLEQSTQFKSISFIMRAPILTQELRLDYIDNFLEETFNLEKYQSMGLNFETFKDEYEKTVNYKEAQIQERIGKFAEQLSNIPNQILILNFNYTPLITRYIRQFNTRWFNIDQNQIHGKLENTLSMIFGYGDEEAEGYKNLENLQTKGLLNNVKSINYLQTGNYRKLLQFIDSDNFQVFIMGMSCSLADRTLLRKVFQHNNCVSIKPFYYRNEENTYEDYTDIIQNISRCFKDKDQLRERVVDKEKCMTLPQFNDKKENVKI